MASEYRWLSFLANKKTRNTGSRKPFLSLHKLFNFAEPQFSHLYNGHNRIYLRKVVGIKGDDVYTTSITEPWTQEVFGEW